MKKHIAILLALLSIALTSCKYNDIFINPYDPNADMNEIQKICEKENVECDYISVEYRNSIIELFCGKCSDGYECRFNTCWDIDECDDLTLNNCPIHSDCHNLDMESDGQPYECICKENYSGDDCVPDTRLKDCEDLPDGAMWNTASRIEQTWNGTDWIPSNKGTFDETSSSTQCRYKCKQNYTWTGSACKADTRTANCTGLPANAQWNTASSIEQTWNGEEWAPSTKGTYNESKSSKECRFKCKNNFEWNGSECVDKTEINDEDSAEDDDDDLHDEDADSSVPDDDTDTTPTTPCDPNPCDSVTNSTGSCTINDTTYICGCDDGYFWNGSECHEQITLGNICTGQNRCYDNEKEIPCPIPASSDFYGQDAQYAKAGYCYPQSFTVKTVSGQNIVVDNNTGLEWQQTISEDTFTWYDAVSHCENLEYGGYSDWRLPTPQELRSLIDQGKENPSIDGVYFPDTPNDRFWSSLITVSDATLAWELRFAGGGIGVGGVGSSTSTKYYARCVRGKTLPESSFVSSKINSEDIVTDTTTGLMWQTSYEGTEEEGRTWQQALSYCENLAYAGYSDWRLPNVNELASLINYDKYEPASDFPEMPSFETHFCSSTTYTSIDIKKTIDVRFSNGHIGYGPSEGKSGAIKLVRCVRSEKINDPCENNDVCENMANSTEVCVPENAFEYSCECIEGHFWDGENCVDPCSTNPCSEVANSNKTCTALSWKDYSCSCNSGYFWNGNICEKRGLSLGKICTGQTTCYNNSSSITCPSSASADFYGQDAQYRSKCTAQSFTVKTVSNQKVVVDNNTLLEWQQTLSTSTYTWDNAVSYCNNLTYAGYTDWRLPTPLELLSITNISKSSPATNTTYFPNMPSSNMWTSKAQTSTTAFDFNSSDGRIYYNRSKNDTKRVVCIRGNELPKGSFTSATTNGKVVVTDSTTGLMWQKETVSGKTWQQALKYCENSTYAGYSDWRLPNKNELSSLLNYDRTSKPYSDFPNLPSSWFWASSSYSSSAAWYVGFENGYHGVNGTKSRETYVLCVRN